MINKEVDKLLQVLPDNYTLATQILDLINNNTTKVEVKEEIKGNYYSYINDTIYISNTAKNVVGENKPIVISHECRHSVQNKKIQLINTIISNIVLILIFLCFIFVIMGNNTLILPLLITTIINICVRQYLEMDATYNSLKILLKYVSNYHCNISIDEIKKYYEKKINIGTVLYFFKIIFDKSLPIIVIFLIKIIKLHIF